MQIKSQRFQLQIILALVLTILLAPNASHAQWKRTTVPPLGSVQTLTALDSTLLVAPYGYGIIGFNTNTGAIAYDTAGLGDPYINTIFANGSTLYAGTLLDGIYQSTNAGLNWSPLAGDSGLTNQYVNAFYSVGNLLYAATNGGVFVNKNNAASWTKVDSNLVTVSVQYLTGHDSLIFGGSDGNGISLTYNWGYTWAASDSDLYSIHPNISCMTSTHDTTYLATTDMGIWYAIGYPVLWQQLPTNFPSATSVFCMLVNGSQMYAGTSNGVFQSTNYGQSWALFVGTDSGYVYQWASTPSSIQPLAAMQNHLSVAPNPFTRQTTITYTCDVAQDAQLVVYNLMGQEIQTLASGKIEAGTYNYQCTAPNDGIYLIKLQTPSGSQILRIVKTN